MQKPLCTCSHRHGFFKGRTKLTEMFRIQCLDPDILASFARSLARFSYCCCCSYCFLLAMLLACSFWASHSLFFVSVCRPEFRFLLYPRMRGNPEWESGHWALGHWAWGFISCTGAIKFVIWATSVHWTQRITSWSHREFFVSVFSVPFPGFFLYFFQYFVENCWNWEPWRGEALFTACY